jgi:hypothetical protein
VFFADNDFQQQRLRAWQPLLTAAHVIFTFGSVGVCFIVLGVVCSTASNSVRVSWPLLTVPHSLCRWSILKFRTPKTVETSSSLRNQAWKGRCISSQAHGFLSKPPPLPEIALRSTIARVRFCRACATLSCLVCCVTSATDTVQQDATRWRVSRQQLRSTLWVSSPTACSMVLVCLLVLRVG